MLVVKNSRIILHLQKIQCVPANGNETLPDVLQTTILPYVLRRQCGKVYGRRLTSSAICAGGQLGRDSCLGDSGGPLMGQFSPCKTRNHYFLIGVVSFGAGICGLENYPGVYVNVAEFVEWVLDNMKE